MHFVSDLVPNEKVMNVSGIIFPVNETSWEHMKMLWYPFLTVGIVLSVTKKDPGLLCRALQSGLEAALQHGHLRF